MSDPNPADSDVGHVPGGEGGHLACGARVDDLLEQAANGRADLLTMHQRHCPHCMAALSEFTRVWEPVRQLAATPVSSPTALKAAVADRVRKLVADVWYTLALTDGGSLRVAARVVATVAREAARTVPGVRVAFGRSTQSHAAAVVEKATLGHLHPNAAVGVLGRTAVVELAVAVDYGSEVEAVAREVQRRVGRQLRANVGLQDVTVNVTVDDVFV